MPLTTATSDLAPHEQLSSARASADCHFRLRNEADRERDVFRYLHPWNDLYRPATLNRHAFPSDPREPIPQPIGCDDRALNAITQLGALRLNTRRCIVTLVTSQVEYVLAESTHSLKRNKWIGTCQFPRDEGLTAIPLGGWRNARKNREHPKDEVKHYVDGRSPHWCIVSDLRHNREYSTRVFVKRGGNGHRFYFSVPLRDSYGAVIGSLAVLDDKPRYGVSAEEMTVMEDLAKTISEHLNATLIRSQRQRSEKLIQALALFDRGKDSLRQWWLEQDTTHLKKAGRLASSAAHTDDQEGRPDEEFGSVQQLPGVANLVFATPRGMPTISPPRCQLTIADPTTSRNNASAGHTRETAHVVSQDLDADANENSFDMLLKRESIDDQTEPGKMSRNSEALRVAGFDLAYEFGRTYERASQLLREALYAEGVVFVDATSALSTNDELFHAATSDQDTPDTLSRNVSIAKVNGFSARSATTETSFANNFQLPERFLAHLIKHYPEGEIFNFEENGDAHACSEETPSTSDEDSVGRSKRPPRRLQRDAMRLQKFLLGARTIAFYPLRDAAHDKYHSSIFVWSATSLRFFDPNEDITYLAAFGHSLTVELSRLETVASDGAKSSFISSISHELRSPLHGILAGVEFLKESRLTAFQVEMANTIDIAGRTLLDTVNHILDFSKISSFTRTQMKNRVAMDTSRYHSNGIANNSELGVTFNLDLARLTEEVVETVVSAFRFNSLSPASHQAVSYENGVYDRTSDFREPIDAAPGAVSVTFNATWRDNWIVKISPGSWTRILTNVVGNALKYTKDGQVSIRLEVDETTQVEGSHLRPIQLVVEDTGIGISPQFLAHGLYTPFQQEDSHSPGTGLGLSIVQHIVREMGADLKISSQAGRGTRVDLKLNATFVSPATVRNEYDRHTEPWIKKARDKNLDRFHLLRQEDLAVSLDESHTRAVCFSALENGKDWLNCRISSGQPLRDLSKSDVCAISDTEFRALSADRPQQMLALLNHLGTNEASLLVLAGTARSTALDVPLDGLPIRPIFVHQPIGPRKLLRAIISLQDSTTLTEPSGCISSEGSSPWPHSRSSERSEKWPAFHGGATEPPARRSGQQQPPNLFMMDVTSERLKSPSLMTPSVDNPTWSNTARAVKDQDILRTVLLVEDNDINMKLLVMLMKKLELKHQCASNGREALDAYAMSPTSFSLILMDLSMPVMDGYESTAHIRLHERRNHISPCMIIALTGMTSDESRQQALSKGVDKYYTKPIRMKQLSELIEEIRGADIGSDAKRAD